MNLNLRTVMMVCIALVAAGATALFARGWLNAQRAAMGGGHSAYQVLVAKSDIGAGRFLRAQDLRWQGWPKGTLAPTYIVQGKRKPEDFDGAVVRKGVVAGQPVTDAHVVRPGEQGFLAAVLEPGMRAVSIQVNAITGISGFVFPGDRVDMVLTHTVPTADRKGARHVSETVLQDVRVLAVDQKTDDQKGKAAIAKTVTFEVTPKQVEKIGIVNKLGKISLSLRPIAGEAEPEQTAQAMGGTVKAPSPAPKPAALAPIAGANAAVPMADAPLVLLGDDIAEGVDTIVADDATEPGAIKAEIEAKELAQATPEAAVKRVPRAVIDPTPRRERAGITLDSEVSRMLGHGGGGSNRKVQVIRGSKAEEQKF